MNPDEEPTDISSSVALHSYAQQQGVDLKLLAVDPVPVVLQSAERTKGWSTSAMVDRLLWLAGIPSVS